ncbi:MAG: DUF1571 domain-containing protein [Planctomycetaceae bacterium]
MSRSRLLTTGGPNILALLVACSTITIVVANSDPVNTGGSPGALNAASYNVSVTLPPAPALPEQLEANAEGAEGESKPSESLHLSGHWGLKLNTEMLRRGCLEFANVESYTATFTKQERIGGVMSDAQVIDLKVRQAPFSVYMKWLTGDSGRQLIYVDGQNEGNLLVQPGGIRGRLTGVLTLDPEGTLAMAECRYPVTKAGLVKLAETIISHEVADLGCSGGYRCELRDGEEFDGRPCYLFICEYDQEHNPEYRKSVMHIDKELSLPICVRNYTWGVDIPQEKLDEETLVEYYAFTDLEVNQALTDEVFDPTNPEYHLRVKKRRD